MQCMKDLIASGSKEQILKIYECISIHENALNGCMQNVGQKWLVHEKACAVND